MSHCAGLPRATTDFATAVSHADSSGPASPNEHAEAAAMPDISQDAILCTGRMEAFARIFHNVPCGFGKRTV